VTDTGPPEFLNYMPALLAQAGVIIVFVRTAFYFAYKGQPQEEYTPPEPCGGKRVVPYNDEEKFTRAILSWDNERVAHDQEEERRIAELHKQVRRMGPLSALTYIVFMFISPSLAGSPLNIGADIAAVIVGSVIACTATVIEIAFQRWRLRKAFIPQPFDEPAPWYVEPPPSRPPKPNLPPPKPATPPAVIKVTSLPQAFGILGLQPGKTTISEARAAYRARMAICHPDKVSHLHQEFRDLAARKALELNLAIQFIENNRSS
jgi:hypothetical protein